MSFGKKKEQPKAAPKPVSNPKGHESCAKPQEMPKKNSCCGGKK